MAPQLEQVRVADRIYEPGDPGSTLPDPDLLELWRAGYTGL